MKREKIELTKNNYFGLASFWGFLLIGIIGGLLDQKWAENIYTFLSICLMIIFIFTAILKAKLRPIKENFATFFIHVLFNVAMGWWWLVIYWIITIMCLGIGMHHYLETSKETKETSESEKFI